VTSICILCGWLDGLIGPGADDDTGCYPILKPAVKRPCSWRRRHLIGFDVNVRTLDLDRIVKSWHYKASSTNNYTS
jgi:hypothetical protein